MTLSPAMTIPIASLFDPDDPAEGSLDPLGTYLISESMASRIGSPGVRERQRNLRFLTLCCIGWEVIASIEPDLKPGDPSASLEQAFEWMVLESLVEGENNDEESRLRTLPGIMKARTCIEQKIHLNADRYLRMPSVFGFFGVYRTLAEYLDLVTLRSEEAPILGEQGVRLFRVWKLEQGLPDFGRDGREAGSREFNALVDCLRETWKAGQCKPEKRAWEFIQEYMQPTRLGGPKEAADLERIIRETGQKEDDGHRREILNALDEPWARKLMQEEDPEREKKFHQELQKNASASLKALLKGVLAYEGFIRPLQNLFDDLLFKLSSQSRLIPISQVAGEITGLETRISNLARAYDEARIALQGVGDSGARFEKQFQELGRAKTPSDYLLGMIEHHERIQRDKPPLGKAPWTERQGDKIGVRPLFRRKEGAPGHAGYVYFYRTRPLFDLMQTARGEYGKEKS